MTDPQDDVPCRDCKRPTQHATERCDDCRTPAGRILTALAARGIKGDKVDSFDVLLTAPLTREQVQALAGFTPWPCGNSIFTDHEPDPQSIAEFFQPNRRPLIAAAPALHATCLALLDEVARLTAELSKPVARGWCQSEVTDRACRDAGDLAAAVRMEVVEDGPPWGWCIWDQRTHERIASGPETGDAGRHAADLALVAAGYRLIGGVHPLPSEVSDGR